MAKLSARLERLASSVLAGELVADIGTDRALLAIELVQRGRVPRAIAIDLRAEPLTSARLAVEAAGLQDKVELRLADGFEGLHAGEAATAIIAGIGGKVCAGILRAGVPASVLRLVVQVNWKIRELRECLSELQWELIDESIDRSEGRYFVTMVAERAKEPIDLSSRELEFGPHLLAKRGETFTAWLDMEIERVTKIVAGLKPDADDPPGLKIRRRLLALLDERQE